MLSITVNASDISILTYREDYRPLETVQAEIILDKEPLNDLTVSNLEFSKNNNALGIIFYLEKLSSKRYFIYFNIPDVSKDVYNLKVKNVNFVDSGVLKRESKEIAININGINTGFNYLLENQNQDGSFGDITKTSFGALALKNIEKQKADIAISYLTNNQDPIGCYPKNSCNIKDTSFTLLALSKFNQNYIKTKNWLKDASNNFELGLWNLRLEGSAVCGNINLNGIYDLSINNKIINITCNNPINFELTHNYLGSNHLINEYRGNNFSYAIDDSGCYGIKYKEKCDYLSTLYASWALYEINEDFPEEYLIQKKLDNRTIDHALGYILYHDDYDKDWLLNNYLNGYWSYNSASISQTPDYFTSALAAYSLRNEFLFQESKSYLSYKTRENIQDSALILYLLFYDERKLPSVSISPGISNQKNSFNLNIKNNKEPIIVKINSPNFTGMPSEIYLQNEFNYKISRITDNFEIKISYGNYSYSIPVIGLNQKVGEEIYLLPPPRDAIRFLSKEVSLKLNPDDRLNDELVFINNWSFKLTGIKLNFTGTIKDIIEFDQDYFYKIESNETIRTGIYLNRNRNPVYNHYEGYIVITSSQKTLDAIKFSVDFSDNFENEKPDETKSENETLNEELPEKVNETKKHETPEKKKNLWWVWLVIILIIGLLAFLFLRRKKEVTQDFDDYAKKLK